MKLRLIFVCLLLLNSFAFAEGYYLPKYEPKSPILNDGNQSNNIQIQKEEVDFYPYMNELKRRIKKDWYPPKGKESLKIVLLFRVEKNGKLGNINVVKSSGDTLADKAAINAVRAAAPFRPLPAEFRGQSIDIQFYFDYNVLGR